MSPCSSSENDGRVTDATQLRWGSSTSRVSSIETIFVDEGMNSEHALRFVVFPDAVPPEKMSDLWFSMASQRKAIRSRLNVCQLMRSMGVCGTSWNCRMV